MPAVSPRNLVRPASRRSGWPGLLLLPVLGLACSAPLSPAPPAAGPGRVSGEVVEIDAEARRFELADAGRRVSVFYDPETLIRSRTASLGAGDIRKGDLIVVSLDGQTPAHARLIALAGPPRTPTPASSPEATGAGKENAKP